MKIISSGLYKREKKSSARCRTWQVRFIVEDEYTHERQTITEIVHGTFTVAQARQDEIQNDIAADNTVTNDDTVNSYIDKWITKREDSKRLAKRTIDGERNKLQSIRMHIGNMKMSDVNAHVVNVMYQKLSSGDSLSGRKLKGTTICDIHKSFSPILKAAVKDRIINAAAIEDIIVPSNDTDERIPLTTNEVRDVIAKLDSTSGIQMLILVCLTCGLRRSEAVILDWSDLVDGELVIRKAAEEDGSKKKTKSKRGNRTVPVPSTTLNKLQEWNRYQSLFFDRRSNKNTPMFTNRFNGRYKPHSVTAWWRRNREKMFDVTCSLHDLRHTYTTMLARQGVHIRVAQELIGDATTDVLMQIYTHVSNEDTRKAVAKLDGVFSG